MKISALLLALLFIIGAGSASAGNLVEQPDPSANLIGTQLLLQAGLDRQRSNQNGLAALVAACILRTRVAGTQTLRDAVRANGGAITYVVEPRDVRFYLEGVSGSYGVLLDFFRAALAHPDFGQKTLNQARSALDSQSARRQRFALDVGIDMLDRNFYQHSNAGMPPNGLPETLAAFTSSDARAFFESHYRSGGAVVSVVGNAGALPDARYSQLISALASGASAPAARVSFSPLPVGSHQLIAHRDVPVPWLVAQYSAPQLRSRDFGPMLVLTSFMERTLADVSGVPAIATQSAAQQGVGAFYNFDTNPANLIIYVDGGLGDPTRTFDTALTVVNVLGHAKLGGDLTEMKDYAAGRFLEDTSTLEDRAWLDGVFAAQNFKGNYRQQVVKAIDATTAADLQRVATRYLDTPNIALVLPRS